MNSHTNARTTFAGRKLLIKRIGVVGLRRARIPMRTIAQVVGRSVATISRVLAALGPV
jgi:uncharacterized protein YerC